MNINFGLQPFSTIPTHFRAWFYDVATGQKLIQRSSLAHTPLPPGSTMRVLRGSHKQRRLDDEQIEAWQRTAEEVCCLVPKGGALLMRPLLLHASGAREKSSPSSSDSH
jgi:ectoine hydroxylase-related dioxygenase (phytanoyl-CoA dioxygenase family)